MTVSYNYKARTPQGTRMSYARFTESVQVMARGIDEAAGLMSFMAPSRMRWGVMFPPGAAQEFVVEFADGSQKRFRTVAKTGIQGAANSLELP